MTREEREQAIAILENEKKCVNRANKNDYCNRDCYNCELVKTDTEILTALDMAIKALEQSMPTMVYPQVDGITPTVVAQTDGEYITQSAGDEIRQKNYDSISRQAVLDIDFNRIIYTTAKPAEMVRQKIEQLPPVTPHPKTGHWIDRDVYDADRWKCSECGRTEPYKENYCPKCGAKMN